MHNFATPHCHPQSFDSASTPEAFAEREIELNTGALTVTDHGTMGACRRVYDLAKAKKLTPILGLEAYFRDDDCPILKAHGIEKPAEYLKYYHITIHCLDEAAFQTLSWKLSHARMERHGSESKPLFNWADLEEIGATNATITSGCLVGMVQRHIFREGLDLPQRYKIAEAYYTRLRSITKPGNWYVEVFPHKCDANWTHGVFVTGVDGTKLRFWESKQLQFEHAGKGYADRLAELAKTNKWVPGDKLVAVMNNRKWQEQVEPMEVASIEHIEDFIPNECQPWCPDGDVQRGCNRVVQMLAQKYGDKILISDDSHYAHPEEKIVQDIRLRQMGNWRFYGSYHRQSSEEAFAYFRDRGTSEKTFEGWVENNREWSGRFKDFTFTSVATLPTKFYPTKTLDHTFSLVKKHGRMQWHNAVYMNRLKAEIDLLHKNGTIDLLPYFFLGEEVCAHYESIGMLTGPGRGSAAGLLLTYLLGITHADPLKYSLSMDRFLTADRVRSGKMPDIDQDLPTREPLVGYEKDGVKVPGWLDKRFGDHFAQIGIDTTLKLKSSIKDVARVIHDGRIPDIIEDICKKLEKPPQGVSDHDFVFGYEANGETVPGYIESSTALQEYVRLFPNEWDIVQKCLGLARQKGRHPCGYVIANRPVAEFIPLMEISGFTTTQYTAPSVEAAGALKMDFLVINSLNDIQDCIKLIQGRSGLGEFHEEIINNRRVPGIRQVPVAENECVDIWDLPEDLAVFRDVAEGKTETVFQFNTPGAIQWLRHFDHWKDQREGRKAIDSIESMSAFTALDRPGPLNAYVESPDGTRHNMLVEYARRARGEAPIGTLPIFAELLPETYGVMVYQEQLQKMYQNLTGCSGPEAEEFRTNVAKKKMDKVNKAFGPWMARVGAKIGEANAKGVWDFFVSWGQYGFNKSHSVCYCIIGYACAWLKHHFPLEWWCAVLRNADKNEINEKFWGFCGHLIDLPDIAISGTAFEIVGDRLRAPTSLLQGVGPGAHEQLMKYAPYASLEDFCQKIESHCVKGAKPVKDKNGNDVFEEKGRKGHKMMVQKMKRASNAIHRGVSYKLIVSGAMDSFFPKTQRVQVEPDAPAIEVPFDLIDKLQAYEAALSVAQKKKQVPVKEEFTNLGALERFQMKKSVLPAYSEQLLATIVDTGTPGVFVQTIDGRRTAWMLYGEGKIPFVSPQALQHLDQMRPFPETTKLWAAMPAFVIAQRVFSYKNKKLDQMVDACELVLDVDGVRMTFMKWPNKEGHLDAIFKAKLEGAVITLALSKYKEDRPFGLESIHVVQPPLGETSEEKSPATAEEAT